MENKQLKKQSFPKNLAIVLIGIFVGLSAYTIYYSEALSYLSSDSKVCANCHLMQEHYDVWSKSSHHKVATCSECHMPHDGLINKVVAKADNGFLHGMKFTPNDYDHNLRIRDKNRDIANKSCANCHKDLTDPMHITYKASEIINCAKCHNSVGHRVNVK